MVRMGKPKLPWWIPVLFSLGIGFVTWLAAPYLPPELTGAGIVLGIACVLLSVIGTLWHFRSVLGRTATGLAMIVAVTFAAYASVFFWQKANATALTSQPSANGQAPVVKPAKLTYRVCGAPVRNKRNAKRDHETAEQPASLFVQNIEQRPHRRRVARTLEEAHHPEN